MGLIEPFLGKILEHQGVGKAQLENFAFRILGLLGGAGAALGEHCNLRMTECAMECAEAV